MNRPIEIVPGWSFFFCKIPSFVSDFLNSLGYYFNPKYKPRYGHMTVAVKPGGKSIQLLFARSIR